ncbi:MAG: neutral/alkaline non-lysosomal ceramidase N-terminal domain-containing protein [Acidobacteria bacterium]|nr:neutral/alkaline non-lysosomal ceramidase N-terminal domain-containing protein [Acidobacteriota bacterium]
MKTILIVLVAALPLAARWKAGVSRIDITPTEPVWMAGYGNRTKPSEGVRQKIWVKALALEDNSGARAVLVTSDLLGFNKEMSEAVSRRAREKYKLERDKIAINSSHTHSAPVTGMVLRPAYPITPEHEPAIQRYTEKLLNQTVDAIGAALADLQPATLSFGQSNAGFAANRRRVSLRHLPGPVDHDVPVMVVRGGDNKARAIVFGYACHATALSDYQINGDWPGFAQAVIEKANPGAAALFVAGAGADANPLPRRTVELAEHYGMVAAEAVAQAMKAKMVPVAGPLKTAFQTVDLAFAQIPTREELERRVATADPPAKRHAKFLLDRMTPDGKLWDRYPYPVQVWQFGSALKMIILGGELVVDYSLRLKAQYGWGNTWIAGYSNDVFAYIPSVRVLKEGGYEGGGAMIPYGQPGPFHPAVEETIIEMVERLVKRTAGQ